MKLKKNKNFNEIDEYNLKKLKLKCLHKNDIEIFSTLCQDGIFSIDEMIFQKNENIFIATFSRFCWEYTEKSMKQQTFYRVVSGIRVFYVKEINYENFQNVDASKFVNLLSVEINKNILTFNFSLNVTITLHTKKIKIFLDDLDMPWPTGKKPIHE